MDDVVGVTLGLIVAALMFGAAVVVAALVAAGCGVLLLFAGITQVCYALLSLGRWPGSRGGL